MSPYKYGVKQIISLAYKVQPTCQLFKTNWTCLLKKYDPMFNSVFSSFQFQFQILPKDGPIICVDSYKIVPT
jgi:hypothetical protein